MNTDGHGKSKGGTGPARMDEWHAMKTEEAVFGGIMGSDQAQRKNRKKRPK
jgi:hypothetical protein